MGVRFTMDQPSTIKDRRQFARIPKKVTVQANILTYPINDEQSSKGKSKNLSQGGILIEMPEKYETGVLLQVEITLPGWRKSHPGFIKVLEDSIGSPFTAICEVVRSEYNGKCFDTAVKFINIDADDKRALEGYLDKENQHKES